MLENIRFALLLDTDDAVKGSNSVPVFEFADDAVMGAVEKAESLGAKIVVDGLKDPDLLSIVFSDPCGNEFEVSTFHE